MSHTRTKDRKQQAFVTVAQAAETLCVSPETIRRRMDDGLLKGYRLAGVRRIFASELDRFIHDSEPQQ
jgi:excisionase family DNA binding protein